MTDSRALCPKCGRPTNAGALMCLGCGQTLDSSAFRHLDPHAIVVRTYKGKPNDAMAAFQRDAASMAQSGYRPIAQTYAPGSWGAGAFIIALLLCLFLIGILIFIYLLIVKPAGTLTVTYQRG